MTSALRQKVIVQPGGVIEIKSPDLPAGASAEVIVLLESVPVPTRSLASLIGAAKGGFASTRVCHTPGQREWAREDDGDGVREVHCNTMEGIWTGLRNFLRPLRGVNKGYLGQYTAVFEVGHNLKEITPALLRAMLTPCTSGTT